MACFIAPAAAAIIISATRKKIPEKYRLAWLLTMLLGGIAWLIPEHIYNGEIVAYPPFFTKGLSKIIPEVMTVGVSMLAACIALWILMCVIESTFSKKLRLNPIGLLAIGALLVVIVDTVLS